VKLNLYHETRTSHQLILEDGPIFSRNCPNSCFRYDVAKAPSTAVYEENILSQDEVKVTYHRLMVTFPFQRITFLISHHFPNFDCVMNSKYGFKVLASSKMQQALTSILLTN
jgi:hypothetical protein